MTLLPRIWRAIKGEFLRYPIYAVDLALAYVLMGLAIVVTVGLAFGAVYVYNRYGPPWGTAAIFAPEVVYRVGGRIYAHLEAEAARINERQEKR